MDYPSTFCSAIVPLEPRGLKDFAEFLKLCEAMEKLASSIENRIIQNRKYAHNSAQLCWDVRNATTILRQQQQLRQLPDHIRSSIIQTCECIINEGRSRGGKQSR